MVETKWQTGTGMTLLAGNNSNSDKSEWKIEVDAELRARIMSANSRHVIPFWRRTEHRASLVTEKKGASAKIIWEKLMVIIATSWPRRVWGNQGIRCYLAKVQKRRRRPSGSTAPPAPPLQYHPVVELLQVQSHSLHSLHAIYTHLPGLSSSLEDKQNHATSIRKWY